MSLKKERPSIPFGLVLPLAITHFRHSARMASLASSFSKAYALLWLSLGLCEVRRDRTAVFLQRLRVPQVFVGLRGYVLAGRHDLPG